MAKRKGEHAKAVELWLEIVCDPKDGVHACEQLAIYYERQGKDLARATEFAQLAVAKLRRAASRSRDPYISARFARLEQKLQNRLKRLDAKRNDMAASLVPMTPLPSRRDAERMHKVQG